MVAVDPETFGRTAWYRPDLNEYSLLSYLTALGRSPDHVFVSGDITNRHKSDIGKPFDLQISGEGAVDVYVAGPVSLWPSVNPYTDMKEDQVLMLVNLNYLEAMVSLPEPEVWIRRNKKVDDLTFYTSLLENGFSFTELDDSWISIRSETGAPQFLGFNGALSLSFIVTVAVSLLGFVVAWIISLHSRILQFGVFRSLGMSSMAVVAGLVWEQLLVSGGAVAAGSVIGGSASQLFLPILGLAKSAGAQVPALQIGAYRSDYLTIFIFVAVMLVFAFSFLGLFVSKLKVHQALKLGEE